MPKQLFDEKNILKALSAKDIWRWKVIERFSDSKEAAKHIAKRWEINGISVGPLNATTIKGKTVFSTQSLEDSLAIKLVDRYMRRVYKVRQSDRNRMVKQLAVLLKDPGGFSFIRFDIKSCYENINFRNLITKIKEDLILSPVCTQILEQIADHAERNGLKGLPRGLPISTTLAELYLERLDKELSKNESIIYSARYVDDCIIVIPSDQSRKIEIFLDGILGELKLSKNEEKSSFYQAGIVNESIDLLGYSLASRGRKGKPNEVIIRIAERKLKKIKTRIALSMLSYKSDSSPENFKLLKYRMYYLSTLTIVKKGKNGYLMAGNAYNYRLASDFSCLKKIDKFYHGAIQRNLSSFSGAQIAELRKISFYGNAINKKSMKLTRRKAGHIQRVWKDKT